MNAIAEQARQAGIVGAGGAGFPTHVKLAGQAEIYLVNGAECEPLLKVDQQLAHQYAAQLVRGLELAMQAVGASEGIIALKAKYEDAITTLTPLLKKGMRIHILKDVYPAGDEVITIWMATGRRVPPGGLPKDVGVAVNNVLTLINLARAVDEGTPVTTRTLTVTGAVAHPITVTVPLGITLREVLVRAGGLALPENQVSFINGGPMMGKLVSSLEEPVTKTTGGLIALPTSHTLIQRRTQSARAILERARTTCEQCLLCTELCPRHIIGHELPPHLIVRSVNYNHFGRPSTLLSALTCSECAVCEAWACPVDISPMRLNQMLKVQLRRENARYEGPLHPADPMAEHRLVPVSRLIAKLGIKSYHRKAPLDESPYEAQTVVLPLRQHVGAPAIPCVAVGDHVEHGQLLADIPEKSLGARIHASIKGRVTACTEQAITLQA